MIPSYSSLLPAKGGALVVKGLDAPNKNLGMVTQSQRRVRLAVKGDQVELSGSGSTRTPGMWVDFLASQATYGLAAAGESWAASGPFSGCHLLIGMKNGQIMVSHLAQQSGSTSNEDWAARGWQDEVWARWKVPIPSLDFFSNSVVFVDWSRGKRPADLSVVRIDVKTKNGGAFDPTPMHIFDVVHVVDPG